MRYIEYSLKEILTKLTNTFSGISEIYLFGSRLHRTRSTRSDVDLLITVDPSILGEDIRDFALQECRALDFFLIDNGVATSCANSSKVTARSKRVLIQRLGALKIWSKNSGFLPVDIDWEFKVIKGSDFQMTTLLSSEPFPSKAEAVNDQIPILVEAAKKSKWASINEHPIWIIVVVACAVVIATYSIIYHLRIVPLEREISNLKEKKIDLPNTSPK